MAMSFSRDLLAWKADGRCPSNRAHLRRRAVTSRADPDQLGRSVPVCRGRRRRAVARDRPTPSPGRHDSRHDDAASQRARGPGRAAARRDPLEHCCHSPDGTAGDPRRGLAPGRRPRHGKTVRARANHGCGGGGHRRTTMHHAGPDAEAATGAGGSNGRSRRSWADSGLVTRIAFAAIAVAIGLAIVFAVLFLAILSLHQRSLDARRSQQVIATGNELQTYVIDLETGARGFAITREERFLDPWKPAQALYPGAIGTLVKLTKDSPTQHRRALAIESDIQRYFSTYSFRVVDFLRRNPQAAPDVAIDARGRKQVEAIRRKFKRFLDTETALSEARNQTASATTRTALVVQGAGLNHA